MSSQTQSSSSLFETVDIWETVVNSEQAKVSHISLECLSGLIPMPPHKLVPGEESTVGRTRSAEVSLPADRNLSRTHFTIECLVDEGVVRDLGSTNGTYVNGRKIRGEQRVYDGDHITAGTTTFAVRFVLE